MNDHPLTQLAKADISLEPRLQRWERKRMNTALAGLDTYWNKPGQGWAAVFETLAGFGVEPTQTLTLIEREEITRQYTIDMARSNKADPFSPLPINNSALVLTVYYNSQSDRYEVLAYVS